MIDQVAEKLIRRVILGFVLGGLLLLGYAVLHLFIVPVAWAIIISFSTWPLYRRLRNRLPRWPTLSALLMTLLLTLALVLPAFWMVTLLRGELASAIAAVTALVKDGPPVLPGFIASLPWIGDYLQNLLGRFGDDPEVLREQIGDWVGQGADHIVALVGDVGRNAAKLGFALITVFFLYRDGERVFQQVNRVLHAFLGSRVDGYLSSVGTMTKAVVWGLVATAFAQGLVAGIGYWWAGIAAPVTMGALTVLIAMIPFGAPVVWGTLGVWLIISGDTVAGVGLLIWGVLVVSWVDNLVRPLVISNATRIPFLLVMFGVLGGLAAFGLIGLFLGPVILAVLMAVWREWIEGAGLPSGDAAAIEPEKVAATAGERPPV